MSLYLSQGENQLSQRVPHASSPGAWGTVFIIKKNRNAYNLIWYCKGFKSTRQSFQEIMSRMWGWLASDQHHTRFASKSFSGIFLFLIGVPMVCNWTAREVQAGIQGAAKDQIFCKPFGDLWWWNTYCGGWEACQRHVHQRVSPSAGSPEIGSDFGTYYLHLNTKLICFSFQLEREAVRPVLREVWEKLGDGVPYPVETGPLPPKTARRKAGPVKNFAAQEGTLETLDEAAHEGTSFSQVLESYPNYAFLF